MRQSQWSLQLRPALARHDIHIQGADLSKDLGLDVSSARKPSVEQWPRDAPRQGDVQEDARSLGNGLRGKPVHALWRTGAWAQRACRTAAVGSAHDVDQAGEDESR